MHFDLVPCVCLSPYLQTLLAIVVSYVLSGHPLTPSTVFVTVAILNILRVPMGLLPIFIAFTMQVYQLPSLLWWLLNRFRWFPGGVSKFGAFLGGSSLSKELWLFSGVFSLGSYCSLVVSH